MKLAVVGSRGFSDIGLMRKEIRERFPDVSMIVSGGASGADKLAERVAEELGVPVKIFLPKWKELGKKAGCIRNAQIVQFSDKLIAFWDGSSAGTAHSIRLAEAAGKQFAIIEYGSLIPA